ncbi:hypothetical protein BCP78_0138 [Bacillus phage BCP78]|uniref:Uncharacterized protein n=2 Tax=Tsarbombavirus BCP78 TaxID=1985182 RepID=J9PRM2_9CAUD|nr:hypothetical protein BCP78_0138 [Bacillus phage BCP78]YP_009783501.1 hypothetical protein QLX27_gp128 [Bacillus phage BCU4]AEW47145.1 hypothetical protein BCP78_0138 [Bacillus phage BCP78]AEW47634.1 hypothetical protein BCU4_0128 [Bacillus phage BCU4]
MEPKELSKRALESVYWRAMENTAKGLGDQYILKYMKSIEDSVHAVMKKQKERKDNEPR